ncbi:MAG: hypothetical protein FWH12_08280 [Treponema sp.]|nr:hypothetical protein [Treponema sp.]
MINAKAQKILSICFFIVIYALCLGARIYWMGQKESFHVDEGSSMVLSNYQELTWTRDFDYHRPYTGREIKDSVLIPSDPSLWGALKDIGRLWQDSRDEPQTNLYYSFLRLAQVGYRSFDIQEIIHRGSILNFIFFTISFIMFFLLLRLLFPDSILIQLLGLFCAFISTAAISNSIFLRPYQLQETLFIIFTFFLIRSLQKNELVYTPKTIIPLALITALTLLSGYFALVFIGLFGLYIIFRNIRDRTPKNILYYLLVLALGLALARFLYLGYFNAFFSYRATELPDTIIRRSGNITLSLLRMFWNLHWFNFSIVSLSVVLIGFVCMKFWEDEYELNPPTMIFLVSILFIAIIMIAAPYKQLRYVMSAYPFLILFPIMQIHTIGFLEKKTRIVSTAMVLLLIAGFIYPVFDSRKVENLFPFAQKERVFNFTREPQVPVVMISRAIWKYADMIPHFHDTQTYYFNDSFEDSLPLINRLLDSHDQVFIVTEYYPEYFGLGIVNHFVVLQRHRARFYMVRRVIHRVEGGPFGLEDADF